MVRVPGFSGGDVLLTTTKGLSFSVLPPTKPPPSLKNIYKQIATDVPTFKIPTSGYVPT